ADKRQLGELKHLSSRRKRKQNVVLLGKTVKCQTLDGNSPVAKSITSLRSDPSSMEHVESCVNQQGPPCKAKYSWVTDSEVVLELTGAVAKASIHWAIVTIYGPKPRWSIHNQDEAWFSPKCIEAQQLTRHLGVKHCFGVGRKNGIKSRQTLNTRYDLKITGSRSTSKTIGDKLHRQEGKNPDYQLRPLNDRSIIKEMNGAKRFVEAVRCKNASVGEYFALGESTCVSGSSRSGSE
ncbi:hypothetical protein Goshw_015559, partial [Gossypium schwendimanii]|nr:hypothetical protein [Gossypium schwendimanii]